MKKVVKQIKLFVLFTLLGKKKPKKKIRVPLHFQQLNDQDMLNRLTYFSNIAHQLQGHPHYTVPQSSLVEIQILTDEFNYAKFEYQNNKSGVSLYQLQKAREKVRNLLQFLHNYLKELKSIE